MFAEGLIASQTLAHRKLLKEAEGDGVGGSRMGGTYVCTFVDSKLWCYRHHVEHEGFSGQQNKCISSLLGIYNPVDYSQRTSFLLIYS